MLGISVVLRNGDSSHGSDKSDSEIEISWADLLGLSKARTILFSFINALEILRRVDTVKISGFGVKFPAHFNSSCDFVLLCTQSVHILFQDNVQFCFILYEIFYLRNTYSEFTKYNNLLEQTSLFITVITITILCTRRGHKALILIVSYCRSGYSK